MRAGRQAMQAILESPPRDDADLVEPTPSALGVFASRAITLLLVAGPVVAFVLAVTFFWGSLFNVGDLALAAVFYLVTGFGVTVGYHRLFPVFAIFSFAAPFFLGWLVSGAIGGALTALLWAGVARMALLHHVTWSVNSVCHMFGKQPATQRDHSTNFAFLSVISFGESW